MTDLNNFKSQCQPNQRIIVSEENKRKHIANNLSSSAVRHYRIDNYVISGASKKCDFLLLNDSKCDAYYIELKGTNLLDAMTQIDRTVEELHGRLNNYTINPRIVYASNTHAVHDKATIQWKQKYSGKAKMKTVQLEDIF